MIIVKDLHKECLEFISMYQKMKLFSTMERQIFILNCEIIKKIEVLRIKRKAINISVG